MKLLYRGAEAVLYTDKLLGEKVVVKKRVEKKYKHADLDKKLRESRARNEVRMLRRARKCVATPFVLDFFEDTIVMEFVPGKVAKNVFSPGLAKKIGVGVRKMHDSNIVHNDLTTSNVIVGKELSFVDFGLAGVSDSVEDKAVDLVVFKKMLSSTHYDVFKKAWPAFLNGYKPENAVLNKVEDVERRARYL